MSFAGRSQGKSYEHFAKSLVSSLDWYLQASEILTLGLPSCTARAKSGVGSAKFPVEDGFDFCYGHRSCLGTRLWNAFHYLTLWVARKGYARLLGRYLHSWYTFLNCMCSCRACRSTQTYLPKLLMPVQASIRPTIYSSCHREKSSRSLGCGRRTSCRFGFCFADDVTAHCYYYWVSWLHLCSSFDLGWYFCSSWV